MPSETARKLAFEVLGHVDPNIVSARLGRVSIPERTDVETPNFLAVGSRGVIPHMTPDVITASSKIGGIHMALEDCKLDVMIISLHLYILMCSSHREEIASDTNLPGIQSFTYICSSSSFSHNTSGAATHSSSFSSKW